jgi:hypothetical protein
VSTDFTQIFRKAVTAYTAPPHLHKARKDSHKFFIKKKKNTDRYQYISCEEVTKATLVMARESGGGVTDYTTEDDNTHLLPPPASWRLDIDKFRLPRESHKHGSHDRVSSFSLDRLLPTSSTHYLISSLDLFSQLFVFLLRYCSCYFN